MRRRSLLRMGVGAGLLVGLRSGAAIAGPRDAPLLRKASFSERSGGVVMDMRLPELLRASDADAMASLDSGFATRLVYYVAVFRYGARRPVAARRREVRIHFDPWNERYVVETIDDGRPSRRRDFDTREQAIRAAVHLRIRVALASDLERGQGKVYYVRVSAQRNPLDDDSAGRSGGRSRSRDVDVFGRWVSIFVRARLRAEVEREFRSPNFYLVEQ